MESGWWGPDTTKLIFQLMLAYAVADRKRHVGFGFRKKVHTTVGWKRLVSFGVLHRFLFFLYLIM